MKDLALDESGDILIESGDIKLIRDQQQEIQKIRQILGTKLGEWKYNKNEGIDFDALFQKNPDPNRIRETIQNTLHEINENYVLQNCSYSAQERILSIKVSAESQKPMELYLKIREV